MTLTENQIRLCRIHKITPERFVQTRSAMRRTAPLPPATPARGPVRLHRGRELVFGRPVRIA